MRLAILAGLALAGTSVAAQPLGGWAAVFGQARLGETPFSVHAEVQLRGHRLASDLDQLLLRGGAQFTVPGTRTTLTQGYAFVRSEAAGTLDAPVSEHRLYQEALVGQRAGPVRLSHRVRLEERFVGGAAVQTRLRYALFATVPVTGDAVRRGSVYATGYAEPFVRGPGRGDRPVYDRTRLYGAVGVRATDRLGVQAGVLAQAFDGSTDWQLQLSLHPVVRF